MAVMLADKDLYGGITKVFVEVAIRIRIQVLHYNFEKNVNENFFSVSFSSVTFF
jgi:hypothetical protein